MSSTFIDSLVESRTRPVPVRRRSDLTARRHRYQGKPFWVIKEPIGLKYSRLHEEEYFLLMQLDGRISLEELKKRYEKRFIAERIKYEDLQQFLGSLHQRGLVISESPVQGWRLYERAKKERRKKWMGLLTNIFAIRWKGIDPDWILNFLYPYTRWFFTGRAVSMACLLGICALLTLAVNYGDFLARMPTFHEFFGPGNWLAIALTMAAVKVLHEFGHGLACKRFGGECHEMGFMLLVFTPALYCNVSDSWLLESKWRRAAIGAAGMYVELTLASIATLLWWGSEPGGMLSMLCLRVMFVCSISTLMFNGNPLLRFDGYYILADLAEIPNLRQKAGDLLRRFLFFVCLGIEPQPDPYLPQRHRALIAAYSVASYLYRWVVVFSILMFVTKTLEPYGLKNLGRLFGLVGVIGMIAQPVMTVYRFFRQPGSLKQVKRWQAATSAVVLVALLIAVWFAPAPHYIACPLEVQPLQGALVYVTQPGVIAKVAARPGAHVEQGDTILELENLDVELKIANLHARRSELEADKSSMLRRRFSDDKAGLQLANLKERLDTIERAITQQQRQLDQLVLKSPRQGMVLPPPERPDRHEEGLPSWSGAPLDPENQNALLQVGDLVCIVGDAEKLEAVLLINQNDTPYVRPGQIVSIQFDSLPGQTFRSEIREIAEINVDQTPASLSTQAGGDIETTTDESGVARPITTHYQAKATLESADLLQIGVRGQAKIHADWRPIGPRVWRYLSRTFRFDL
ncbi:hemolysin D [Lignipirellula cremea]|uniref:Peptide zinc metalloprotease protein YydH n=1 Tax=Lignipirellula cremea TaxID=2528010 RepID=A0A518DW90_9BACT|nr:hemolysin D [Lignipirellula cremea]QDU96102.1 Putative peptide zinc metalloprotease protein YydH [Lignipirellula cremea]